MTPLAHDLVSERQETNCAPYGDAEIRADSILLLGVNAAAFVAALGAASESFSTLGRVVCGVLAAWLTVAAMRFLAHIGWAARMWTHYERMERKS